MKLTDPEKLILIMLSEIHEKLGIENGVDPKFVQSAIYSENTWGLRWKYTGIFTDKGETPAEVTEVVDILDMWSFIESAYHGLSADDKERIRVEAEPFGTHVRFAGFDGNNESEHIGIARFLIDDLDRFTSFKGRDLNSHSPSLEAHRRMLAVFLPLRTSLGGDDLTATQIVEILRARFHRAGFGRD